jgi:hypothetical protein
MPAKLTRVGQASTSTGTGNFTLGAALTTLSPAVRAFDAAAGSGDSGFLFFYSIMHKTLNELEDGIGYMSDANTLIRHKVFRSTNDNELVNFSAGDKDVICTDQGNLQDMYFGGAPVSTIANKWQVPNNQAGTSSAVVMVANRLYAVPMVITNRIRILEWMVSVTTLAAGTTIRAALAERLSLTTYRIVLDLGEVDSSTTGDKVFPDGQNTTLPAGNYFMLVHSSGAPAVRGRAVNYADLGTNFLSAAQWVSGTLTWSGAWPSPVTGINAATTNAAAPSVVFRTEDDYV